VNPDFYPKVLFIVATFELERGGYAAAKLNYTAYLNHPDLDRSLTGAIGQGLDRANFGLKQINNPVPFVPINIGKAINTHNDEYMNTVSTDEATLIFTRKGMKNDKTQNQRNEQEEDFFESKRADDKVWQRAVRMSSMFNTNGNEGAMNISPDQTKMVFTACYRQDGFGSCDLYFSERRGKTWSIPMNMGEEVNTGTWDSNPCLSADGKTVYFVSKRAGGQGASDIWTAERLPDGRWGNVMNLGATVNSKGAEMTPYIHPDGKTLYFASDGHLGMGKIDLFLSRKNDKGQWTEPVNLGYPINDYKNQMGLLINAKGDLAYISSDMRGGEGGYDIYTFDLYDDARPTSVNYMKGVVADFNAKRPLQAKFQLYDLNSNTLLVESESDALNGDFLVVIPSGTLLGLNVSKPGYLFYSEQFEVKGDYSSTAPFLKNVYLKPLQVGQKIVLENIFFASASYELEKQSFVELQKVKELLQKNPTIRIEISGYTDNVGDAADNVKLSNQRAKAVFDYLVSIDVPVKNLTYKGYGEEQAIADNATEEGRKKNRRTELKVIGL
jgi:outer membrane protein OmpA-like peptidoglycan-associated protein